MEEQEKIFVYNENAFLLALHTSSGSYRINNLTIEAQASQRLKALLNISVNRFYVLGKFYQFEPNYSLIVNIEASKDPNYIGRVVSFKQEEALKRQVGSAQAWFYPTTEEAVLWECLVHKDPFTDQLDLDKLYLFWNVWEETLTDLWPSVKILWTPEWDPLYKPEFYKSFLKERGFSPSVNRLWVKYL